jgi:deazaflavin-dependent oxidoreductase (nitroreductase family)
MSLEQAPLDSPTQWVADHIRRYVATDGRDGHIFNGTPTLLLTTLGRKSGLPRRLALIYGRDGDDYVVVGSNGGAPKHPAWYNNLVAHPEVKVQVLGDKFMARARTATPEEHARLWPRMVEIFPTYAQYQKKTDRPIPLVILSRV